MRYSLLIVASITLLSLVCATELYSQTLSPGPQFGIAPTAAYQTYDVDAVNMDNGNDIIKIPLFSLPQLGKLSLSYQAVSNTAAWVPEQWCSTYSSDCSYSYVDINPTYGAPFYSQQSYGLGPTIVPTPFPGVLWTSYYVPNCYQYTSGVFDDCASAYWNVYDSTGASHPLYYDSTNQTQLRSTDGSGFLYLSDLTNPYQIGIDSAGPVTGPETLIDSHGVTYTTASSGTASITVKDPDGNTMTATLEQIVDSLNRTIPSIPQATSSTANCPNLGQTYPYQTATSSAVWYVPGTQNNGTPANSVAYTVCYATITIRTDFFGCTPQCTDTYQDQYGNPYTITYEDDFGTTTVIQSIVLPDQTYWGFVYDAADPNNNNDIGHYGTVTKLIFPHGGSISYSYGPGYGQFWPCNPEGPNAEYPNWMVMGRAVTDANGNTYNWTYHILGPGNSGSNWATDPNGNDTVYQYSGSCSGDLEISKKIYQGSHTSGTLLLTTTNNYQTTTAPQPYSLTGEAYPPYGNALLQSVTTSPDSAGLTASTSTTGFAGSLAAVMPTCYVTGSGCTLIPENDLVVNLTYSIPSSSATTDYTGSVIKSTSTVFRWQSNATPNTNYASYLSANLLDTPNVVTTYNSSTQSSATQVAQTTYTYDESAYSGCGICGHVTSMSSWLNTNPSASPISHFGWNAGQLGYSIDPNRNTTRYTYPGGSNPTFPYPSSVTNALNQTTSFTWDFNTGFKLTEKDPNMQTTSYVYDCPNPPTNCSGQIQEVTYPDNTTAQPSVQYAYSTDNSTPQFPATVTQTTAVNGATSIVKKTVYDGLDRVIHAYLTSDPDGTDSVDTTYDGLNDVLSVTNQYRSSDPTPIPTTNYEYDALKRKVIELEADGSSKHQWCYDGVGAHNGSISQTNCRGRVGNVAGVWVDSADENGDDWQRVSDALGRLLQVVEPGGLQTNYSYDALGNLWSVAQLGGSGDTPRNRNFTYDSLSRLLCASTPENSTGTCPSTASSTYTTGTLGYTYDSNGNVLSKEDARGVTTGYGYDSLNHLISKTYSGSVPAGSLSSCYQYGLSGPGNLVGRLVAEWTQSGTCPQTAPTSGYQSLRVIGAYDAMGRVVSEQQCVLGYCTSTTPPSAPASNCSSLTTAAGIAYCYDLAGDLTAYSNGLTSTAFPQGWVLFSQTYDSAGRLASVGVPSSPSSPWSGSNLALPPNLFTVNATNGYAPFNALQNWTLGTNLNINKSYDNRLRVLNETATQP